MFNQAVKDRALKIKKVLPAGKIQTARDLLTQRKTFRGHMSAVKLLQYDLGLTALDAAAVYYAWQVADL